MRISFLVGGVVGAMVCLAGGVAGARAESSQVFGIHFWDWCANVDVMSHRPGWVVEANLGRDGPNVGGRLMPATAQGFTIIQRLDWTWEQTIPLTTGEQDTFAAQCGSWAGQIKNYCRYYSIGNEVELFNVTPEIYTPCFQKVRNAIRAQQPEAQVLIGHMLNTDNQYAVMQALGPDGYDGVTAHAQSTVPSGLCEKLDLAGARPGVGVYITEWGWEAGTEEDAWPIMQQFAQALGNWNATHDRQVYCACWYLYPDFLGAEFSLETSPIDNAAFENATFLNQARNTYMNNMVVMSDLLADIADAGTSAAISWSTSVGARTQLWWTPAGSCGAGMEAFTSLDTSLVTQHTALMNNLWVYSAYEVLPTSSRNGYGDANGRRFRIKTGPWLSSVTQTGAGRVEVSWSTDWPSDSRLEYGPTPALGGSSYKTALVTDHSVEVANLEVGTLYYRFLSSEPNPDAGGPRLHMRSPVRSCAVETLYPGDMDGDEDVDQEDFGLFQVCYSGTGVPQTEAACRLARMDPDEDVDLSDLALFVGCLSGPGNKARPDCTK